MPKRERKTVRDARRSGDADRLHDALKAEADRQLAKLERASSTFNEINLEIEALEFLRRDAGHA